MLRKILRYLYNKIKPVQISGINNVFNCKSRIGNNFIVKVSGSNNSITIGEHCLLTNTFLHIAGENNRVIVEDRVRFMGPCRIIIEGGNSTLHIKYNAGIRGVEFNLNGANIEVGELCMFSYGITLRNHDSHKVLDREGRIVNLPRDIILGKHVWIAQNATILKGCHIGANSVIGFGSIVTKSCDPGSILTGVPAKVVKENISWDY